jgi:hypothetical protein
MDQLVLNVCVYGCFYEDGSSEAPNIKIEHGLCRKCGKDQRGKKCMHLVDDHDKLSDGYCNKIAAIKYSKKVLSNGASVKRCRLHYYMDCCDEAHEKIAELEADLEEAKKKS